jgi:ArsR family transcriptional regulator
MTRADPPLAPTIEVLRALASQTRARALNLLLDRELCVCELVDALGRPHYSVSRDLAVLQKAGLVRERRAGSWVYHSIAPEARADSLRSGLLGFVEEQVAGTREAKGDRRRLELRLSLRVGDRCVVAVAGRELEPVTGDSRRMTC